MCVCVCVCARMWVSDTHILHECDFKEEKRQIEMSSVHFEQCRGHRTVPSPPVPRSHHHPSAAHTHRSERCSGKLPSSAPTSPRTSTGTSRQKKSSFCFGYKLMRDIEGAGFINTPGAEATSRGRRKKNTKPHQRGGEKEEWFVCVR